VRLVDIGHLPSLVVRMQAYDDLAWLALSLCVRHTRVSIRAEPDVQPPRSCPQEIGLTRYWS